MKKKYVADLFCGAGGTSTGLLLAAAMLDIEIDLTAINHWPVALDTHSMNHPWARHLCENLDNVNPRKLFPHGRLHLMVASPECTHFSIARGGVPCSEQSRSSAWHILNWATALYIDNILIENVPEFMSWGPLGANGRPMKSKKGETFHAFLNALRSLGYKILYGVVNTADYGDPTCRKRLFILARRGKRNPLWPEHTHSETGGKDLFGETLPWVPAYDIIDWSIPGESIFNRPKPLSKMTLARIEHGLKVQGPKAEPFLIMLRGQSKSRSIAQPVPALTTGQHVALCEPFLVMNYGTNKSRTTKRPSPTVTAGGNHIGLCEPFLVPIDHASTGHRGARPVSKPWPTVITQQNQLLIEPFIIPQQSGAPGQLYTRSVSRPIPTIATAGGDALVEPFVIKYYGTGSSSPVKSPLGTVMTKDHFGLVIPEHNAAYDIRYRMLQPHELAAAQSFPKDYKFAGNKTQVIKQIGNAVPVKTAMALCKSLLAN